MLLAKKQHCSLLAERAAILVDLPLPATESAKERDATVRAWDATVSAALALAEDKQRKEDKQCQEEATAKVSIFIYLHWPILMNNMSTEDDCNLAASGLIQLRGSAVLNENAIESIKYFFDGCCTGTLQIQ
jgi:hypothetical protein